MSPQRVQRKPLELHIYPHWEDLGGRCYSDREGLDFPINVDYWILCKRLEEAELAAEVWHFDHEDFDRTMRADPDDLEEEEWDAYIKRRVEAEAALQRFATHPHYDEAD